MSAAAAPGRPDSLLSVDDLKVRFTTEDGIVHAVDGVSFDLQPGEILGIVGESGSGKSVTAQTLMGLTRSPNAEITGSVRFHGADLVKASEEDLQSIRSSSRSRPTRTFRRMRPSSGRSSSLPRSASPTPTSGSMTTRTSSQAGCASGP
jgi:ABC-type oligopeptide transport system ATPase subunit